MGAASFINHEWMQNKQQTTKIKKVDSNPVNEERRAVTMTYSDRDAQGYE
jgi:hypothetical protein